MTGRIEKTVFISYRRTNLPWALFVYQNLTMHGYDVFFDYQSIDSGDFESVILENIKARAHFIIILTPSALENCKNPNDWLRREIETAIDENRNIVPLMVENFDFGSPLVKVALSGKLSKLNSYNGLQVPNAYALEAMERLRHRFLNKKLIDVPTSTLQFEAQKVTENQKKAANQAPPVKEDQLTAQSWFERAYLYKKNKNLSEALRCYTESINLNPNYSLAYSFRGHTYMEMGEYKKAISDLNNAVKIDPKNGDTYFLRSIFHKNKGDSSKEIADLDKNISLNPSDAELYYFRARASERIGDLDTALNFYNKAIALTPHESIFYTARGVAKMSKNDLDGAINDLNTAISLDPDESDNYFDRALIWKKKKDHLLAIKDYKKYLDLGGGERDGDQKEVEIEIEKLKIKLSKKQRK